MEDDDIEDVFVSELKTKFPAIVTQDGTLIVDKRQGLMLLRLIDNSSLKIERYALFVYIRRDGLRRMCTVGGR